MTFNEKISQLFFHLWWIIALFEVKILLSIPPDVHGLLMLEIGDSRKLIYL